MEFHDAAVFRKALEHRLDQQTGGDPLRLFHARVHVVLDRLLARLLAVAPGQWALTGPLALDLRLHGRPQGYRAAKIEWPVGYFSELRKVVAAVVEHDAGDFYEFEVEVSGGGMMGGGAVSMFRLHSFLAEEAFETVSLDLTCRYGRLPTEPLGLGDLLGFAGIEPVEVEAVLLEVRLAEMAYEYIGQCARGFDPSSAKNLFDICSIAERSSLDATLLREAIDAIFAREDTDPPMSLPSPFEGWAEPFRRMAESAEVLAELITAATLLDPVLSGEVAEGRWSAVERRWSGSSSNGHPLS